MQQLTVAAIGFAFLLGADLCMAQEDPRETAAREAVNGQSDGNRSSNQRVNADAIRAARGKYEGRGVSTVNSGVRNRQNNFLSEEAARFDAQQNGQLEAYEVEANQRRREKQREEALRQIDNQIEAKQRRGISGTRSMRELQHQRAQIANGDPVTALPPDAKPNHPNNRTYNCVSTGPTTQFCH